MAWLVGFRSFRGDRVIKGEADSLSYISSVFISRGIKEIFAIRLFSYQKKKITVRPELLLRIYFTKKNMYHFYLIKLVEKETLFNWEGIACNSLIKIISKISPVEITNWNFVFTVMKYGKITIIQTWRECCLKCRMML